MSLMPLGLLSFSAGGSNGGNALTLISTVYPSSASVTFSSIPGTYKHLQVRIVNRTTSTFDGDGYWYINGDTTSSNYSYHVLRGNGSTVTSAGGANAGVIYGGLKMGNGSTANAYSVSIIDILDYANTNKNKTVRILSGRQGSSDPSAVAMFSGGWFSTAAINSLAFTSDTWVNGSRFSLYGVS